MKRLLQLVLLSGTAFLGMASAQQEASLSGIIKTADEMPAGTRVALHVVDRDSVWQREVASVEPVGGTFSITTSPVPEDELTEFRSGAVLLPGLQNEYTVTPENVRYAAGRVNMYVDKNDNAVFDRVTDAFYIGVPSLESPTGFFSLVYVDQDATVTGKGIDLNLKQGWNIFMARFPEGSDPVYEVAPAVDDVKLDVFLP